MQVVKILCDWCYDFDGKEVTSEKEVTLSVNGKAITADLCVDHVWAVENAEIVLHMFKIGRKPDKPVMPVKAPKAKAAKAEPAPAPEPNADGEYACDMCERTFGKPQGLGRHKLSAHNVPGTSRSAVEPVPA